MYKSLTLLWTLVYVFFLSLNCQSSAQKIKYDEVQKASYIYGVGEDEDRIDSYVRSGNYSKAEKELLKAIEIESDNIRKAIAYSNLGYVYLKVKEIDNAIRVLKKAVELDPSLMLAHKNLGSVYFKKEMYKKAIEQFKKTIDISPAEASRVNTVLATAYMGLGNSFLSKGDYDESIRCYKKAVEISTKQIKKVSSSNSAEVLNTTKFLGIAYMWLGQCYVVYKGNYDDGIQYYNKSIEILPDEPVAYVGLLSVYLGKESWEEVISLAETALERKSEKIREKEAIFYFYIGQAYFYKGEMDKSITSYNKAIRKDSSFADAYIARGDSFAWKEQYNMAVLDYEKAIQLLEKRKKKPTQKKFAKLYYCLYEYYSKMDEEKKAAKAWQKAKKLNPELKKQELESKEE